MTEHGATREPSVSFVIASATLGGVTLGPGTALVDEDVLRLLLFDSPLGEKALQVRYESIVGVAMSDGSVMVSCRDGRGLVVLTNEAASFRGRVLAACRALPEVTRALRALGSRRGARGTRRNPTDKEARFFAPLIAARRASMNSRDAASVIESFDAKRLAHEIATTLLDFAAEGGSGHSARRRALEAELSDAAEQLSASLTVLDDLAARAAGDVDDLGRWRLWAGAVQRVFEAADRSWAAIEPVMGR